MHAGGCHPRRHAGTRHCGTGDSALKANASDSDGTVTRVDFYAGTTLVGVIDGALPVRPGATCRPVVIIHGRGR
jgi:hypothetical protein